MKLELHRVSSRGVAGAEALRAVSGGVLGRLGMMLSTRSRSASVLSITGPTLPVARRAGSPSCPCRGRCRPAAGAGAPVDPGAGQAGEGRQVRLGRYGANPADRGG